MFLKQGKSWTLLLLAVTFVAKPPGTTSQSAFDPWAINYASDSVSYALPWNDWELTSSTFPSASSNSTPANTTTAASPLPPVPSGLDMKMMKELTADLSQNQAFSPFVLGQLMTQVWLAAEGTTRNEMTPVLGLTSPSPDDFLPSYKAVFKYLSASSSDVTTAVFSRVYVREKYPIYPSFSSVLSSYFMTSERLFSSASHAASEINDDVSNVTDNRIQNLVSKVDLLDADLVLISALYFKAPWKFVFTSIKKAPFLTASGEKQVNMMSLSDVKLPHIEKQTFDAIALPYSDGNYSMLLLRPLKRTMAAVATLKNSLRTLNITDIMRQLESAPRRDAVVKMPRFTIETDWCCLTETMRALGIKEIFSPGANFGGLTNKSDLVVGKIKHKVYINVTEEGTEAAAAVAAVHNTSYQLPPRLNFAVDRPFVAIIYNTLHHFNLCFAFIASP